MTATKTRTGAVKTVRPGVAGYIVPDDGSSDLYFHSKQVVGSDPLKGERVSYTLWQGQPRPAARWSGEHREVSIDDRAEAIGDYQRFVH